MDFWLGIGIGAIVSFAASLLANYFTPGFVGAIQKRRALWIGRKQERAYRTYLKILSLHRGEPPSVIDFISKSSIAVVMTIFGFGLYIFGSLEDGGTGGRIFLFAMQGIGLL